MCEMETVWKIMCGNIERGLQYSLVTQNALLFSPKRFYTQYDLSEKTNSENSA